MREHVKKWISYAVIILIKLICRENKIEQIPDELVLDEYGYTIMIIRQETTYMVINQVVWRVLGVSGCLGVDKSQIRLFLLCYSDARIELK